MRFGRVFSLAAVGLVAGFLVAGCRPAATPPAKTGGQEEAHGHDHPEKGPHGGILMEFGEEKYHGEYLRDAKAKTVTVYLLDGAAKEPVPVAEAEIRLNVTNVTPILQMPLKADPQAGDPKGQSSRFVGTHDQLGDERKLRGEVSATIAGTGYEGEFDEANPVHKH